MESLAPRNECRADRKELFPAWLTCSSFEYLSRHTGVATSSQSLDRVTAVDHEGVADHKACTLAAEPQDGRGNLLGPAQPADRSHSHDFLHRVRLALQHARHHRGLDGPWTNGVDADSPSGVFKRGAFGEAEHAMLGGVIDAAAGNPYETADRGVVHDRAAALLAHLAQLVLHAIPDAAKIDSVHAIKFLAARVGRFRDRRLDAGIVERRIEPPEGGDCLR